MASSSTASQGGNSVPPVDVLPSLNDALVEDANIAFMLARRMGTQTNHEQIRVLRLEMFTYAASIGLQVLLPWSIHKEEYPMLLQAYMDDIAAHFYARYGWERDLCEELLCNILNARDLRRAAGFPAEEGYERVPTTTPGFDAVTYFTETLLSSPPAVSHTPAAASAPAGPWTPGIPEAASAVMDSASPEIKRNEQGLGSFHNNAFVFEENAADLDSSNNVPVVFKGNVQDLDFMDPSSIAVAERLLGLDAEYEPFSQEYADLAPDWVTGQRPHVAVNVHPIKDLTALYPKPTYVEASPILLPLRHRTSTEIMFLFGECENTGFLISPRDNYNVFLELIRNRSSGLVWSENRENWFKLDTKGSYEGMWLSMGPGRTEIFLDWQKAYPDIVLEGNTQYKLKCYGIGTE
ncbi:hypothetical protein DFP73DRAFT_591982 [Morchella snyderi]|nr:hypothetical protein DFP73DRAFT_591982 [Morchella snyderi]